jgi:VanZ family protein
MRAAKLKKVIGLWGPVLIQAGLIFYFSSQPSGSPVLERFPLAAGAGHYGGYGLLALLLYRALAGSLKFWAAGAAGKALLLALLYGASDELHQYFVPGRQASPADLLVDGAGAASALLLIRLWAYYQERAARGGPAAAIPARGSEEDGS